MMAGLVPAIFVPGPQLLMKMPLEYGSNGIR